MKVNWWLFVLVPTKATSKRSSIVWSALAPLSQSCTKHWAKTKRVSFRDTWRTNTRSWQSQECCGTRNTRKLLKWLKIPCPALDASSSSENSAWKIITTWESNLLWTKKWAVTKMKKSITTRMMRDRANVAWATISSESRLLRRERSNKYLNHTG